MSRYACIFLQLAKSYNKKGAKRWKLFFPCYPASTHPDQSYVLFPSAFFGLWNYFKQSFTLDPKKSFTFPLPWLRHGAIAWRGRRKKNLTLNYAKAIGEIFVSSGSPLTKCMPLEHQHRGQEVSEKNMSLRGSKVEKGLTKIPGAEVWIGIFLKYLQIDWVCQCDLVKIFFFYLSNHRCLPNCDCLSPV